MMRKINFRTGSIKISSNEFSRGLKGTSSDFTILQSENLRMKVVAVNHALDTDIVFISSTRIAIGIPAAQMELDLSKRENALYVKRKLQENNLEIVVCIIALRIANQKRYTRTVLQSQTERIANAVKALSSIETNEANEFAKAVMMAKKDIT